MRNLLDVYKVTQTSIPLLEAIEKVAGEQFEYGPMIYKDTGSRIVPDHRSIACNNAYDLHESGGKEFEILSALSKLYGLEDHEKLFLSWSDTPFCYWDRQAEKWELYD